MATLRDIRHRITSVKNTAKITSAMRMVAAAKLRRAQESIMSARPYTDKMAGVLANLAASSEEGYFHPLLRKPETIRSIAVIVISSDRGLCGSFNANLLRTAAHYIDNTLPNEFPQAKVSVYSVGKRAVNFFSKRSDTHPAQFPDIFAQLSFSTAQEIASCVILNISLGVTSSLANPHFTFFAKGFSLPRISNHPLSLHTFITLNFCPPL